MMTRRGFLGALAALPIIGKKLAAAVGPSKDLSNCSGFFVTQTMTRAEYELWFRHPRPIRPREDGRIFIICGGAAYEFRVDPRDAEFATCDQWPNQVRNARK